MDTNRHVQCCRCRHKHTESERAKKPHPTISCASQMVCPRCACTSYYDITPWFAWCWASGLIEMGPTRPANEPDGSGAIVFATGGKAHLESVVSVLARHGYDGTLLVPGIPESELTGQQPLEALIKFVDWAANGNGRRSRHGVVFSHQPEA